MTSFDVSQVQKIAHLARLAVAEDEYAKYARDLSAIMDFVAQLDSTDIAAVAPMAHPLDEGQRLRDDRATEPDRSAELQAVAPQVEQGLYLVPRVVE